MNWMARTRCKHFGDDGTPSGTPCPSGPACKFSHPDNPTWPRAKRSNIISTAYIPDIAPRDEGRGKYTFQDRERRRRGRSRSRSRSRSPRRERERSPRPDPYAERGNWRPDETGARASRPTHSPVASSSLQRSSVKRNRTPSPSPTRSGRPGPHVPRPDDDPKTVTVPAEPPVVSAPVVDMLPTLPLVPSFDPSSVKGTPENSVLSADQQQQLWQERISLIVQATLARIELHKIDQDQRTVERYLQSPQVPYLSDTARDKLHRRHTEIVAQGQRSRETTNSSIANLMQADLWPLLQHIDGVHGEKLNAYLSAYLGNLTTTVGKMRAAVLAHLERQAKGLQNHAYQVAQDKRSLLDRLGSQDARLADLENEWIQRNDDIQFTLEGLASLKIAEMTRAEMVPAVRALKTGMQSIALDVAELKDNTNEFRETADSLKDETERTRQEMNGYKSRIAELELKERHQSELIDNMTEEIQAVKAALEAHISAPKPAAPPYPTVDEIMAVIAPRIIEAARNDFFEPLEQFRKNIEAALQQQNDELRADVASRLNVTMQLVQMIDKWAHGTPPSHV